jgi:stress response protein SCP2
MEILNLNKGDILNLSKVAPSLQNVNIGLGWDTKSDLDSIPYQADML